MALEREILPELFWGSSVLEVLDLINSYDRRKKEEIRQQIDLQFSLADVIANRVSIIFGDKKQRVPVLQPWSVYPDLFEDRSEELEEARAQQETAVYREDFKAYAARWNERNKE